jgi:hypothetical protein
MGGERTENEPVTAEGKKRDLCEHQEQLPDKFPEHGAISRARYGKPLRDLSGKAWMEPDVLLITREDAVQELNILPETVPAMLGQFAGGQRFFSGKFLADNNVTRICKLADLYAEIAVGCSGQLLQRSERKGLFNQSADDHQP